MAKIVAHPTYPDTIFQLTPTKSGKLAVAAKRGGPFNIDWEVHGTGDIKVIWIMGLGAVKTAWQRQTLRFGHEEGDKHSVLVFDNRGMGDSDTPLLRYTTSEMAKDVIELVDHLGWTGERELHIVGVSMGGMISQELGYLIPKRICSLNLLSTAAAIENTTSYYQNLRTRINMFIPKSMDRSVTDASRMMFSDSWLVSKDTSPVPQPGTPGVLFPAKGKYGMFETNYQRFAAQEINKRLDPKRFAKKGFMLQAIAAGWHHKSAAQLKEIGDNVGRERIFVLHGTADNMISVPHGRKLIEMLQPGTAVIKEGVGHVFMLEDTYWHNDMIAEQIEKTRKLGLK